MQQSFIFEFPVFILRFNSLMLFAQLHIFAVKKKYDCNKRSLLVNMSAIRAVFRALVSSVCVAAVCSRFLFLLLCRTVVVANCFHGNFNHFSTWNVVQETLKENCSVQMNTQLFHSKCFLYLKPTLI